MLWANAATEEYTRTTNASLAIRIAFDPWGRRGKFTFMGVAGLWQTTLWMTRLLDLVDHEFYGKHLASYETLSNVLKLGMAKQMRQRTLRM